VRIGGALCGLDDSRLGCPVHGPCQLVGGVRELVLVLGEPMLVPPQHRRQQSQLRAGSAEGPGQHPQLILVSGQAMLVLAQLKQRLGQLTLRERLDRGCAGDARQLRRPG